MKPKQFLTTKGSIAPGALAKLFLDQNDSTIIYIYTQT